MGDPDSTPPTGKPKPSKELLSAFAEGDDSALGKLVENESPRLLKRIEARIPEHLRRRVGASDILQLTVVDLISVRQRFENQGVPAFRKMLARMADLTLARALQREHAKKRDLARERRPPPGFVAESRPDTLAGLEGQKSTPSKEFVRQESAAVMKRGFARLSPQDQEIIRLVDYEEVEWDRVTEILGINRKAAQKRHSRAIARLRELVKGG